MGIQSICFPYFRDPTRLAKDFRKTWAKALKDAGLEYFWLYNLRHSYANRLSAAGVSALFVAQMIGHSSPGILQRYSKAIDEYRRESGNLRSCVRHTSNRAEWIRTQINTPSITMIGLRVLFSFSERALVDFFSFDHYSFYYSRPLVRGISDCDAQVSSFKTKREGVVGPQGFEPRTKGL